MMRLCGKCTRLYIGHELLFLAAVCVSVESSPPGASVHVSTNAIQMKRAPISMLFTGQALGGERGSTPGF